mgnify:CR=1 FL=1
MALSTICGILLIALPLMLQRNSQQLNKKVSTMGLVGRGQEAIHVVHAA